MPWTIAPTLTSANRLPGKCECCNLPLRKNDFAVFTGIFIEYEGEIQFCGTGLRDLVGKLGYVSPEQYAAVESRADELDEEIAALRADLSEKAGLIKALTRELSEAHASV